MNVVLLYLPQVLLPLLVAIQGSKVVSQGLPGLQLVIGLLKRKVAAAFVRLWVELALFQTGEGVHKVCPSRAVGAITVPDSRVGRVCTNILAEGDVNNILKLSIFKLLLLWCWDSSNHK